MNEVKFTLIQTRYEECRIHFYINKNIMFIKSNFHVKNLLTCGFDENWIEIIKDRGNSQYFYNKIMKDDYEAGNLFCEWARECFNQLINTIKKS